MSKRSFVSTARKAMLRRGRALLRRSEANGAGPADFLGGLADAERLELQEIHLALERIERGIYGVCEECSARIPEERLGSRPWERLCATCDQPKQAASEPASTEVAAELH